jgi:hypothetical protein
MNFEFIELLDSENVFYGKSETPPCAAGMCGKAKGVGGCLPFCTPQHKL